MEQQERILSSEKESYKTEHYLPGRLVGRSLIMDDKLTITFHKYPENLISIPHPPHYPSQAIDPLNNALKISLPIIIIL